MAPARMGSCVFIWPCAFALIGAVGCGGGSSDATGPTPLPTPLETATPMRTASPVAAWAAGGSVARSLDGGMTWDVVFEHEGLEATEFADASTGWAVGSSASPVVFRSEDGGSTWADQSADLDSVQLLNEIVVLSDRRALLFGSFNAPGGFGLGPSLVLGTTNGGATWEASRVTDGQSNFDFAAMPLQSACTTDGVLVLACGIGSFDVGPSCALSADAGGRWMGLSRGVAARHAGCTGVATLWGFTFRTLRRSRDRGETWAEIDALPAGFQGRVRSMAFADESHGWLVGDENGRPLILHTSDGGDSWHRQTLPDDVTGELLDVVFANSEVGLAVGGTNLNSAPGPLGFATRDGGNQWVRASFPQGLSRLTDAAIAPLP